MSDQDQKKAEIDNLEVTELEDEDLDGVAGGNEGATNNGCPVSNNCPIGSSPAIG
jgi:hypothetical protein